MTNTITKRLIGRQDIKPWDGVNETFSYTTDDSVDLTLHRCGNVVDVLAAYGYHSTRTSAVINTALTAISTSQVAIELAPGDWVISANVSIPANVTLLVPPGARLQVATGKTVTIASQPIAGPYQWIELTGTGAVSFSVPLNGGARRRERYSRPMIVCRLPAGRLTSAPTIPRLPASQ